MTQNGTRTIDRPLSSRVTKVDVEVDGTPLTAVILRADNDQRDAVVLLRYGENMWDSLMVDSEDEVPGGWDAVTPKGSVKIRVRGKERPVANTHAWGDMLTIHGMAMFGGLDMVLEDMYKGA